MNESPTETAAPAPADTPATVSPGALVRQARERAGLAADDLAAQIKLAKSTLDALERDDFGALSEPVYVRGYYRKIAKVLPIAESELLAAYDARVTPGKTKPATQHIPLAANTDGAPTRRSRGGPGLVLALIAVVIIGVMFFLSERRTSAPRTTTAEPAPAISSPPPVTESAPPEESTPVTSPAASPAAPPAAASPTQLLLEFADSSFVRVEDSRNRTLAIGLVRAGERQTLNGVPPYSVFLGNAQNVKVFFDGQNIDFSPHINTQNDTARFTVP